MSFKIFLIPFVLFLSDAVDASTECGADGNVYVKYETSCAAYCLNKAAECPESCPCYNYYYDYPEYEAGLAKDLLYYDEDEKEAEEEDEKTNISST